MSLLGACFGTVLVPVAILPSLGADRGYLAAIVANLAMGLAAIAMDARWRATTTSAALPSPVAKTRRDVHAKAAPSAARSGQAARLLLAFLSGALVMGLEVLWSRMFSMVHENSVYSFAAVLALFLLGLALGAALARWLLVHRIAPGRAASWAWTAAGLIIIAAPRLFQAVTEGMAYEPGAAGWGALPGGTLLLAAFVLLPAVALCGVFLPSLLDGAREPGDAKPAGRVVGELLAWNTAGTIVGPLLFAFGIAPRLGLWWSIAAIGFLLVAGGEAAAIALEPGAAFRGRLRRLAAPVAACAALAVCNPGSVPRARWLEARGQRLVGIFEGNRGTLAVIQDDMSRWVTFNNHYTLGGTASTGDERQQAHIPLLLHPSPRKVAFLGLGTGITAGAALQHSIVESVTILEILPEAVEAAREYFADANLHVIDDSRTEVIVEDARTFLRFSGRRFDVIVGDLVTPWRPGEALLWSVEHFQSVRRALEPGGLFCQWLPLFQLTEESFAIVTATFLDVFPGATLWRGDLLPDQPALALIGTVGSAPLDPAGVNARVRALTPRLDRASPYLADPAGFWLFLIGPLDAADPRFVSARRNRDARPWIEILSPFTQRGSAGTASVSPLVGRRLEAALQSIQGRALEGTWLERLSPDERRWRDAGAALWHASLLARAQRGREAFELGRRTLAALPEALQIALTGQIVKQ